MAYIVKRALGDRVTEVVYISDSMIALSWCSSLEKKLCLFIQNRVCTILWMVQVTLGLDDGDSLPLYHVEGELNVADLLTKGHPITVRDVSAGSFWQTGQDLLTRPVSLMPLKKYDQIFMQKDKEKEALQECYSELFITAREVEVEPSCPGLFLVEPVANQPLAVDGLYLPFNLVHY